MKINRYILFAVIVFTLFLLNLKTPKNHKIVLTEFGYSPQILNINKYESVTFSTNISHSFWPAANPHPSHNSYIEFDPKVALKVDETWTYKFGKSGSWPYHDHLNPNFRGLINVKETNIFYALAAKVTDFWSKRFVKYDERFLAKISNKCGISKAYDRQSFEECWNNFFSTTVKRLGPKETLSILAALKQNGTIALSDCHNFADDIGSESYWQYVSGQRFDFTDEFSVCGFGFFHGFMLEHVSHGQDFEGSIRLCDSLNMQQSEAKRQCYIGAGSGLTYFYLNSFINNTDNEDVAKKIIRSSLSKCKVFQIGRDDCVYGVYGGLEHLYLGAHGSTLKVNLTDPYSICGIENTFEYSVYCYEKITRPLFGELNNDLTMISFWINKIQNISIRKFEAKNIGNLISQFQIYSDYSEIPKVLNKCNAFKGGLAYMCLEGAMEGIISNLNSAGMLRDFDCSLKELSSGVVSLCIQLKGEVLNANKTI